MFNRVEVLLSKFIDIEDDGSKSYGFLAEWWANEEFLCAKFECERKEDMDSLFNSMTSNELEPFYFEAMGSLYN